MTAHPDAIPGPDGHRQCPGSSQPPAAGPWTRGHTGPRALCPACGREYSLKVGRQGRSWTLRVHRKAGPR